MKKHQRKQRPNQKKQREKSTQKLQGERLIEKRLSSFQSASAHHAAALATAMALTGRRFM